MADDPANPLHRTTFVSDDNTTGMNDSDEGDIEIVEGMGEEVPLPAPVDAWLREQPIGLGQVTGTGDNLLHLAAADGRVDVVEWLLAAGVDPRTEDYAGEDALTLAIRHAHYPVANILIRSMESADEPVVVDSVAVAAENNENANKTVGTVGVAPAAVAAASAGATAANAPTPANQTGPGADETVETAPPVPDTAPAPAKTDTRTSRDTGKKKRGITRDMYLQEGTARHTGTYRRNEGSTNVAILKTDPDLTVTDSGRTLINPSSRVHFRSDPARRLEGRLRPLPLAMFGFVLVLITIIGNYIGDMDIPAAFMSARYPAGSVYDITPEQDFLPDSEVETYRHMLKITAYAENSAEVETYFEGPDSPVASESETTTLSFNDVLDKNLRTAHQRERFGSGYFPSILAPAYAAAALAIDAAVISFIPDVRGTPAVRWVIDTIVLGIIAAFAFAVVLAVPTAFDRGSAGRTACGVVTLGTALGCLPLIAAVAFGGESARAMARHFPAALSVAPPLAVGAFLVLVLIAAIWPFAGLVAAVGHILGGRVGYAFRYVLSILIAVLVVSIAVNSAALAIALAVAVLVVTLLTNREPETAADANQAAHPGSVGSAG